MAALNSVRFRRGPAALWTSVNPILLSGEPGYETDTGKIKLGAQGDATHWVDLPYFSGSATGTLTAASIVDFATAVHAATVNKADLVGGVIPANEIPAIAISTFLGTVADQAGMLATVGGGTGDWVIRSDTGTTWIVSGTPTTSLSSWQPLSGPSAGGVTSWASKSGAVTPVPSDIGLGNVNNTSDAAKPVSTATATAITAATLLACQKAANLADLASVATARVNLGLDLVNNVSDVNKPISTATQAALNSKAALVHGHTALQVSYTPTLPMTALTVQAAIDFIANTTGAAVSWPVANTPPTFPPSPHTHTTSQVTDITPVGAGVVTAATQQAARVAIGAGTGNGTSNLALGTSATTAAPGNHTHDAGTLTFTPTASLPFTDVQSAIVGASLLGGGGGGSISGSSSVLIQKYASGAYAALPATQPTGVLLVQFYGPTQPVGTFPSWVGLAPGQALAKYEYANLT